VTQTAEQFREQTVAIAAAIRSHPMRLIAGAISADVAASSWLAARNASTALARATEPSECARLTLEVGLHRAREHAARTAWRERTLSESKGVTADIPHVCAALAPLVAPLGNAPAHVETRH
jgi:hypothetical protein